MDATAKFSSIHDRMPVRGGRIMFIIMKYNYNEQDINYIIHILKILLFISESMPVSESK